MENTSPYRYNETLDNVSGYDVTKFRRGVKDFYYTGNYERVMVFLNEVRVITMNILKPQFIKKEKGQ